LKLFVISGNTFFVIGGHSNFECKLAKNRVESAVNSNWGREFCQLRPTFPDKPLIKTYDALLEIFKLVDTF
jgi:hypothetical protein